MSEWYVFVPSSGPETEISWVTKVESYLLARDLFLKPGGSLYPSAGSLYFAPFSDESLFLETEAKVNIRIPGLSKSER